MKNQGNKGYKKSADGVFVILLTIFFTIIATNMLLKLYDADPWTAYSALIRGAWGTKFNIGETLSRATPLMLVGLGFSIGAHSGMFNIGGEGQMFAGALGATLVALYMPANTPVVVAVLCIIIAGILFGMIWALPVAYLKTRFGVSEIVMTVMLNEVASGIVSYLVSVPMKDPMTPIHQSKIVQDAFKLSSIIPKTKIHVGVVIAIVLVFVVWFVMSKSTFGYQLRATGLSRRAALYAGMPVTTVMLLSMMLSGGFAGLAGAFEVTGVHMRLIEGVTSGFGFTAIIVAQLGRKQPIGVMIAAIVFATLTVGCAAMQRAVGTPSMLSEMIEGLAVMFFIISEYIVKRLHKAHTNKKIAKQLAAQANA